MSTWMGLFQTTLGDYDVSIELCHFQLNWRYRKVIATLYLTLSIFLSLQYAQLNEVSYPNLAKTVFIIFMIFVPILLLNMLIAMMGTKFTHCNNRINHSFILSIYLFIL
jgi:hypothetical protein